MAFTEKAVGGNIITGSVDSSTGWYTLPDGYSLKKALLHIYYGITTGSVDGTFMIGTYNQTIGIIINLPAEENDKEIELEFPIVDGKSPNTFNFMALGTGTCTTSIIIKELGGDPDTNYFTAAFEPSAYNNNQVAH